MQEIKTDTITASLMHPDSISLVFASHKRAGGGYKNHEHGQEEYIARRTDLVERLQPYLHLYGDNKKPFYIVLKKIHITDVACLKFIKDSVVFTDIEIQERDFIVSHAPVARLYDNPSKEIEQRIIKICETVKEWKTFITGPFGCGFFGNDKAFVKQCFEKYATNENVVWVELER